MKTPVVRCGVLRCIFGFMILHIACLGALAQSEPPPPKENYVVSGTLVERSGKPASGQTIYFFAVREGKVQGDLTLDLKTGVWKVEMPAATSDEKGQFSMELSPETWERFQGISSQFTLGGFIGVATKEGKADWVLIRQLRKMGKPLTFGPESLAGKSRNLAMGKLALGPGRFVVQGRLVDKSGAPVSGEVIYLLHLDKGKASGNMRLSSKGLEIVMPNDTTDATGNFQIAFDAEQVAKEFGARVQGYTVGRQKGSGAQPANRQGATVEFGLDTWNAQTGKIDLGQVTFDSQ